MTGEQLPAHRLDRLRANLDSSLGDIETLWLSQGKYLAGDQITVADLFGACEVEQVSKYLNDSFLGCCRLSYMFRA